jgi:hypothetical protein
MNESEKQFSFTRAASSTSGRAKNQIPISSYQFLSVNIVMKTFKTHLHMNGTKRTLTGLSLAVAVLLAHHEATAAQAPVALGAAATYAVLAGSTVTSTGNTTVNGDLGVSPGTTVAGAPTLNGTLHLGDAAAGQAQGDLTIAYNDAAGRTAGAVGVAGNLGGQTLTPGLYKSTSSLEISSGDLTLDALGDTNAVFIFQMASTLVTTSGRQVILAGGAKAANIFWQVGSSATLGTTSAFKGNILALTSIAVTTGATVEGRLLARNAAVTLDSNTITLATTSSNSGHAWTVWWQNTGGSLASWFMNGTSVNRGAFLTPSSMDPSWKIVGTGDFNGDGKTDILLQNTSGLLACWFMNGTNLTVVSGAYLTPSSVDPSWKIVGTADVNGDGKTDILLQNTTGLVACWFMNGTNLTVVSGAYLSPVADPSWKFVSAQ